MPPITENSDNFISKAIKKLPVLKYALGLWIIAVFISFILGRLGSVQLAIWGTVVAMVLMVILLIIAKAATLPNKHFLVPAKFMIWFCLLSFVLGIVGFGWYATNKYLVNPLKENPAVVNTPAVNDNKKTLDTLKTETVSKDSIPGTKKKQRTFKKSPITITNSPQATVIIGDRNTSTNKTQ